MGRLVILLLLFYIIDGHRLRPCLPAGVSLTYILPFLSQLPENTRKFVQSLSYCEVDELPCMPKNIDMPEHIRMLLPDSMSELPDCIEGKVMDDEVDQEPIVEHDGGYFGKEIEGDWYEKIEKDIMSDEITSKSRRKKSCPNKCTCQEASGHCLWMVDCRGSGLNTIPEVDPDTDCIDLGENNITLSQLTLDSLPYHLTHLELSQNPLGETFPVGLFDFPRLYMLGLANCDISKLSSNVFEGLHNLTILQLSSNRLSSLPLDLFQHTPNLKLIMIDRNNLTDLPDGVFRYLHSLRAVIMHGNNFSEVLQNEWKQSDSYDFLRLGVPNVDKLAQWDITDDSGDDILTDLIVRGPLSNSDPEMTQYVETLQKAVDEVRKEADNQGRDDIAPILSGLRSMDPEFWTELIRSEAIRQTQKSGDLAADVDADLTSETLKSFFEAMNIPMNDETMDILNENSDMKQDKLKKTTDKEQKDKLNKKTDKEQKDKLNKKTDKEQKDKLNKKAIKEDLATESNTYSKYQDIDERISEKVAETMTNSLPIEKDEL